MSHHVGEANETAVANLLSDILSATVCGHEQQQAEAEAEEQEQERIDDGGVSEAARSVRETARPFSPV